MMDDTYPFDRRFRTRILSLCLDPVWMSKYGTCIVRPEYFEQDDESAIAEAILAFYEAYGTVPRDPDDIVYMCDGKADEDTILEIFEDRFGFDTRLPADVAIQFAREQAAKIAILDSVDDVKVGNISRAIGRMQSALAVGQEILSSGLDVVADVDKWLYAMYAEKLRTGWCHIDTVLEGGLNGGELGLVMAPTNRGKSMALVNIAYGAASIGSGKDVVIVTHEMSDEKYAKRLAARMLFRFPTRTDDLNAYAAELTEIAKRLMPGSIRILDCRSTTTLQDIKVRLDRLRSEGFPFSLIVDDYPDLIAPRRRLKDKRFELSEIYAELRELGNAYNVPVWAATQSNRASFSKEIVTIEDIAEDIGKANVADVIIALCQTRDEEEVDRCRLFMAKVRDGSKHHMFSAKFYGDSQAIITTGAAGRKDP